MIQLALGLFLITAILIIVLCAMFRPDIQKFALKGPWSISIEIEKQEKTQKKQKSKANPRV